MGEVSQMVHPPLYVREVGSGRKLNDCPCALNAQIFRSMRKAHQELFPDGLLRLKKTGPHHHRGDRGLVITMAIRPGGEWKGRAHPQL